MLKTILVVMLAFNFPIFNGLQNLFLTPKPVVSKGNSGTLEKMIVANGNVTMNLDLNRLNGNQTRLQDSKLSELGFDIEQDSFFTVVVFDNELRGPVPSQMNIFPKSSASLPTKLNASYNQLSIENLPFGGQYELAIRDAKTGFTFFNVEGQLFEYNPAERIFNINSGRLLISRQFAKEIGRPSAEGAIVGDISIKAKMRPIEVTQIVNGKTESNVLPAGSGAGENAGTRPGPDVVVGDVFGLSQFGSSGTKVGLALGTTSCNYGTQNLNWFRLPDNDHPVIPQNLYRMSGGTDGKERFEQIGQSNVKHAFTALTENICNLGCNGVGGPQLGSGCSDPYSAGLNAGPNLGSKAWINPFTGAYPRGDSATSPNLHNGHSHDGTTHRILTEANDLSTQMNVGAKYFAEGQYVTPHEYQWCQSNPGQCNMNNNTSFREYNVSGVNSPFSFSPAGSTVREKSAINAWTGATFVEISPDPANDGIGTIAYKVTETSPGVWHYEYAIHNENIDRAIQSFSVPVGNGVTLTNIGFHAPPQHPGSLNDGTLNDAGFSETPWEQNQTVTNMIWSSETFAQNPNANAIRWGTMYNFRFDSNQPPALGNATIGFFKTGDPIIVQVQSPSNSVSAVSVSGRVLRSQNRGVDKAVISITDSTGVVIRARISNPFGYYRFDGLTPGNTYTIGVSSKLYTFMPQTMQINNTLTNIDFMAEP